MNQQELADLFERIADLLEIKGEVIYVTRAYRRAAESLRGLAEDIQVVHLEGRLTSIPGIGKAISEKIKELLTTGRLTFLEKLEDEVPPSLLEVLQVPDVGPRKAALFWKQAGIITREGLRQAALAGKLRNLPGMGEKSEARILAGIAALERMGGRHSLETAWKSAHIWLEWLRSLPSVQQAQPAGSLRRWKETIGDLDLVVASNEPGQVMQAFTHHPDVLEVKGQGEYKASVELRSGMRIQLWLQPPHRFGSLWQYATGSKHHNIRLREYAIQKGCSLSERGILLANGEYHECETEEEVYHHLGMVWIPPELREDRGEIQAALENRLPALIETQQRQAELHCHTTWSDGILSIEEMARFARAKGIRLLAITDHSAGLGVAGGLTVDRLRDQRAEINAVQQKLGDTIQLIQGAEVEIRSDGSLDYPNEVLAELDIAIASLHSSLKQPREVVTQRLVNAINNPHIDLIGHPSGRLFPRREGADLDWDTVLSAAVKNGVALEINASPYRLDLNDIYARRAAEMGILLAVNTDAHSQLDFELVRYGISVARRAWLTAGQVINTWQPQRILSWLHSRNKNST